MPVTIHTNLSSLNARRSLSNHTAALQRTSERLASGQRINRAADDAAGLQLSERLRAQIRGSRKALDNVQNTINMLQFADGALAQTGESLQRIRELTVQANNDTYSTAQRDAIRDEIAQHFREIDRIAESTKYNGLKLFDEDFSLNFPVIRGFRVQLGPNANMAENSLNMNADNAFGDMDANNLGIFNWNEATGVVTFGSDASRRFLILSIDGDETDNSPYGALRSVNAHRMLIGALTNRLEGAANNLQLSIENLSAAESRIRNADIAAESAELVKRQILQQASNSILAQANQAPNIAMMLIGSTETK